MKIILNKKALNINPEAFLRQAGYGYIEDRARGKQSFVRRFTRDFYPRLHMYVEEGADKIIFNLHLDQKQASYGGNHMHNAEYEGEVVEAEIARLKDLLRSESAGPNDFSERGDSDEKNFNVLEKVGQGEYDKSPAADLNKKSWWHFWKS